MANLKPVPAGKEKSLGKLPTKVRNKMGYAKHGKIMKASKGKLTEIEKLDLIEKIVSQALPAAPVVPQKPTKVTPTSQPKLTLGRVEWLWLDKLQQYVKARVDTGAASSSIHATNEQTFERDGKKWVRFTIGEHKAKKEAANSVPENATIEMPVVRTVRIRQASADGFDRRPVVKLRVRVGQYEDDVEFTLNDRSSMLYPVLLGRTFLRDVAVVDVSRVYMFKPEASKE